MNTKLNKQLAKGGWLGKATLFDPKHKETTDVAILTPTGKVIEGVWNYKTNHLKCPDGTNVVSWRPLNNYICSLNHFQRFIRKINGKKSK